MNLVRSLMVLALVTTGSACFFPAHDHDRDRNRGWHDDRRGAVGDSPDCVWRDGRRYCRAD